MSFEEELQQDSNRVLMQMMYGKVPKSIRDEVDRFISCRAPKIS
jgi:hypothetical protein